MLLLCSEIYVFIYSRHFTSNYHLICPECNVLPRFDLVFNRQAA